VNVLQWVLWAAPSYICLGFWPNLVCVTCVCVCACFKVFMCVCVLKWLQNRAPISIVRVGVWVCGYLGVRMCCRCYYEQHEFAHVLGYARDYACSKGWVCVAGSGHRASNVCMCVCRWVLNLCRYSCYFLILDRLFNSCHYPCHSLLLKFFFLSVTICRCMPKFLSLSSLLIFDLTYASVLSLFLSAAIYFYLSPGLSVFM